MQAQHSGKSGMICDERIFWRNFKWKRQWTRLWHWRKASGFIYPGSEIYGGLANTWDYGNLGVELKNNVKKAWWQKFIQENKYNVGVDCAILMNPQTWVASGHLGGFSDPLMDCKECHERFRADQLIEDFAKDNDIELDGSVDGWAQCQDGRLYQRP